MDRRFGVDIHTPDFVRLAEAFGIPASPVADVAGFEQRFAEALDRPGPTLLDIDLSALAPMQFPIPAHQRRR
jgi:acetolactate synthase-1/2/3 large subunit